MTWGNLFGEESPYIKNDDRLADVIAAIQTLGTYKFYKLTFTGWADRINGDETQAHHWKTVFIEHPEFFRLDAQRERASLVWRRQHQKLFNVDTEKNITREIYNTLTTEEKKRYSRHPLGPNEISTLINTAINIHTRALEHKQDSRWWIPTLAGLIGVLLGAWVS